MKAYSYSKFDRDLGGLLGRIRENRGLTQQEAADQITARLSAKGEKRNINRDTLRDWENGVRKMKAEDVNILCDFYEVSADVLLGRYGFNLPDDELAKTVEDRHEKNGLSNTAKYNVYWMFNNLDPRLIDTLNAILESKSIERFLGEASAAIELSQMPWKQLSPEEKQEYSDSWDRLRHLGLFPFDRNTALEMRIELAKKDLGDILEEIIAKTGKAYKAGFDADDTEAGRDEMEG